MFNFEELKEEEEELKEQIVRELLQNFETQFVGDLKEIGEVDEDQLENITYYVGQVNEEKVERIEKSNNNIEEGILAYISSKKDEKFNPLSERYKKSIINEESSKELEGIFDWAKEVTKEEKVSLEKQRELLEGYIIGGLAELKEKTEKMGSKEKDKNKIYEDIAKLFNIVKLIIRIRTEENTKSKIIEEKTHYFFEQIKSLSETFLEQNEKKDFDKWLSSLKSELLE